MQRDIRPPVSHGRRRVPRRPHQQRLRQHPHHPGPAGRNHARERHHQPEPEPLRTGLPDPDQHPIPDGLQRPDQPDRGRAGQPRRPRPGERHHRGGAAGQAGQHAGVGAGQPAADGAAAVRPGGRRAGGAGRRDPPVQDPRLHLQQRQQAARALAQSQRAPEGSAGAPGQAGGPGEEAGVEPQPPAEEEQLQSAHLPGEGHKNVTNSKGATPLI